jgi:hypothetical protein
MKIIYLILVLAFCSVNINAAQKLQLTWPHITKNALHESYRNMQSNPYLFNRYKYVLENPNTGKYSVPAGYVIIYQTANGRHINRYPDPQWIGEIATKYGIKSRPLAHDVVNAKGFYYYLKRAGLL